VTGVMRENLHKNNAAEWLVIVLIAPLILILKTWNAFKRLGRSKTPS
jgi:hypothetical protein